MGDCDATPATPPADVCPDCGGDGLDMVDVGKCPTCGGTGDAPAVVEARHGDQQAQAGWGAVTDAQVAAAGAVLDEVRCSDVRPDEPHFHPEWVRRALEAARHEQEEASMTERTKPITATARIERCPEWGHCGQGDICVEQDGDYWHVLRLMPAVTDAQVRAADDWLVENEYWLPDYAIRGALEAARHELTTSRKDAS